MKIISVKYLNGYKLDILFSTGERQVADFKDFLSGSQNPSIRKFLHKPYFKEVSVDSGFLSWNNGEMEISAHSAYNDFKIMETIR